MTVFSFLSLKVTMFEKDVTLKKSGSGNFEGPCPPVGNLPPQSPHTACPPLPPSKVVTILVLLLRLPAVCIP